MVNDLIPTEFYLGQNYPNPFKDKTIIKYCVADKTRVQIAVYDAEGNEIEKLVDEVKEPGTYEVEFSACHSREGGNPLNGYYYYKMIAGDYLSEKKWLCINKLLRSNTMKTFLQTLFFFLLVTQICFGQWYQQNSGTTKNLNAVQFIDANNGFAVGDSGVIIKTSDGGTNWITLSSGSVFPLSDVTFVNSSTGWVVGGDDCNIAYDRKQIILATTNGGMTWQLQFNDSIGPLGLLSSVHFINENNGSAVGGGTDGDEKPRYYRAFLKTTNSGISWTSQTEWIDTTGKNGILNAVQFSDQQIGWAVGNYGTIMKTTNGGVNWVLQIQNSEIVLNAVNFNDINNGWAVGGNHLFITTNGGTIWENRLFYDSSMVGGLLNCYDVHFVNPYTGFVVGGWDEPRVYGHRLKIFNTTDSGITWTEQVDKDTLPLLAISFIDQNNGWAVGLGGTILHTTNGGVSFVEEEQIDEIPTEFLLPNNYPNPFNPITKIKYSVPQSSNVVIKVIDILGSEIETLVNEEKTAGTYEITWYAEQLPSGVYFYRLQAGDFVQTRKMILLK